MKATQTQLSQPVLPLLTEDDQLCAKDLFLLERREKLKAELRTLDKALEPKIEATVKARGDGVYMIGNRQMELKSQTRQTVSWKSLAASLIPEDVIEKARPGFIDESTSYSAKLVERKVS
jgi:hypothetical protein